MKKYIFLIGLSVALMTSCQEDVDKDYSQLIPNEYGKILSLKESGTVDMNMTVEKSYSYDIYVLKGGYHKDEEAQAFIGVLSDEQTGKLYPDHNYKILSQDSYSFSETAISIPGGDVGRKITLSLNPSKIYGDMKKSASPSPEFVLPIHLSSSTDSVLSTKSNILIKCSVEPTKVYFTDKQKFVMLDSTATEGTLDFTIVKTGSIASSINLSVMAQEEVDDSYNIPNNMNYKVLPSNLYALQSGDISLPDSVNTISVKCNFAEIYKYRKNHLDGTSVIPLKIATNSESTQLVNNSILVIFSFRGLNHYTLEDMTVANSTKSRWSIQYGTLLIEKFFGFKHQELFDDVIKDPNLGWMGYISDGFPGSQNLGPNYVVIDLGTKIQLGAIGLNVTGGTKPKTVNFYITEDDDLYEPTDDEYKTIYGEYENTDKVVSDRYLQLHNKLRAEDAKVHWIQTASLEMPHNANQETHWSYISNTLLDDMLMTRYIKIELLPFPWGQSEDRMRNQEVWAKRVSAINGVPVALPVYPEE